jgi:polyhydroxybutyrate depolymerase
MNNRLLFFALVLLVSSYAHSQSNGGFEFEGTNRNYIVYVPSGHSSLNSAPLLFVLHGFTQNAQAIMNYSNFNDYAEQQGFIVVYPNGIGNAWNVDVGGGSTANDVGFISALIDTLNVLYGVDLERVYATGFSNGGFMSYRLACELNTRIAAVASVAGTMSNSAFDACMPGRALPIMHIHGTSDFIVSYNGGFGNKSVNEVISFWTSNNNCPEEPEIIQLPDLVQEGSTVEQHTFSPCDDETRVMLLKVINGGHTWPGATGNSGIGITNRDISASEMIWNFLSQFTNPLVTGINVSNKNSLTVFPNPAQSGWFILKLAEPGTPAMIELYSARGKKLFRRDYKAVPNEVRFYSSSYPSGVLLIVVNQNDTVFSSIVLNL